MYAISYRGMTGTLRWDGSMWSGRLCLIPYLGEYCGPTADSCIAAFNHKVDAWHDFVAEYEPEPIPTDGAPEFPGPAEPEPIPE